MCYIPSLKSNIIISLGQMTEESSNIISFDQLTKCNLQVDVFHQTYHLNLGGLEEGHQGLRKNETSNFHLNERNLDEGLKRRLKK